jgi:hypothetical protein
MRWGELQNRIKPAIPYIYLYNDSSQSVNDDFLIWNSKKVITSEFIFDPEDTETWDRVQLDEKSDGLYKITYECTFDGETTASIYKGSVATDEVSSEIEGSTCGGKVHKITIVHYLKKGDYIQVHVDDNVSSIAGSCRVHIEFLPMKGFNNGSGGREIYKGGVLR